MKTHNCPSQTALKKHHYFSCHNQLAFCMTDVQWAWRGGATLLTAIYRFCSDAFVHSGAAGARAGSWLIASRAVAMGRQLRCHGANRRRLEALDGGGSCKGKRLEAPRFSQALKARNLWRLLRHTSCLIRREIQQMHTRMRGHDWWCFISPFEMLWTE